MLDTLSPLPPPPRYRRYLRCCRRRRFYRAADRHRRCCAAGAVSVDGVNLPMLSLAAGDAESGCVGSGSSSSLQVDVACARRRRAGIRVGTYNRVQYWYRD